MNLNGFHIDIDSSDDQYLFIDVDGFTVIIKREAEGIVVDVYPLHVVDEPIATTFAFHSDAEKRDDLQETNQRGKEANMKTYEVKVAVRILEIYEMEASDAADAADNWASGKLIHRCDEALDTEVLSVQEAI